MSERQQFNLLIIRSGEAGKNLARAMAKIGRRTAVVEQKLIGGSCPNIACLPSKNVIYSAKVAELARRGEEFEVTMPSVTRALLRRMGFHAWWGKMGRIPQRFNHVERQKLCLP